MKTQININCTKLHFEQTILKHHVNFSARPYSEMTPNFKTGEMESVKMTLYYERGPFGSHIGTWQSGSGWYFSN